MRTTTALYPWDIADDPRAADFIAAIGFDTVFLAAAYHAVRARTPRHPRRRIVELEGSVLFAGLGDGSSAPPEGWSRSRFDFAATSEELSAAGVVVAPWVVALHVDGAPGVVGGRLTNAFGDVHRHALCPASADARDAIERLVRFVASGPAVSRILLEALGFQGFAHASAHDKAGESSDREQALLSMCFCADCAAGLASAGVDITALGRRVRDGIERGLSVDQVFEADLRVVATFRDAVVRTMISRAVAAARGRGVAEVSAYTPIDPVLGAPIHPEVETMMIDCWDIERGLIRLREAARAPGLAPRRISAHINILDGHLRDADFDAVWDRLALAGADEVHVYHAGLASTAVLDRLRRTLERTKGT